MRNYESPRPHELVHCPECRYNGFNRLADGRCQCKRCRKKFTPRQRKSRLPGKVLQQIASSFWLMEPAARSCGELGLNRKTIQRYYLILRLRITRNRERALRELFGEFAPDAESFDPCCPGNAGKPGQGRYPVFGVVKRGGEAWVVFPGKNGQSGFGPDGGGKKVAPDCWVFARSRGAFEKKDIERFSCMPAAARESGASCPLPRSDRDDFWHFAKHRLRKYYGGFKRNFPLFIREMEFRFNHRDDADAVAHLVNLLPHGPEKWSGDQGCP